MEKETLLQNKNKILYVVLFVLILVGGYMYYDSQIVKDNNNITKQKTIPKVVKKQNNKKENEKKVDQTKKVIEKKQQVKKDDNKNNELISDLNNVINKIENIKLTDDYIVEKEDSREEEILNLIQLGIIKNNNNKQVVDSEKLNNLILLPYIILNKIKNDKIIDNFIEKIKYNKGTDIVLKENILQSYLKEIGYEVTEHKIKIDDYQQNRKILISYSFILKQKDIKIKLEGKVEFDIVNSTIAILDGKILIMKNFQNIAKLNVSKYKINKESIDVNLNGYFHNYQINIEYSDKKDITIKRKGKGILKRTVFKLTNIK